MTQSRAIKSGGLPARWRRGRVIASTASILLVAAVLFALRPVGRADGIDTWWLAARFWFREHRTAVRTPDPDIVLVAIDDRCLAEWREPMIAWNPHIAKALDILRVSGVKAIGIDRIQPGSTQQWLKQPANNDDVLLASIQKTPNIVWAKEFQRGHWIQPWEPLLSSIPGAWQNPELYVGHTDFTDSWGLVTSFEPMFKRDPAEVGFATRIAERAVNVVSRTAGGTWILPGHARLALRDDGSALIDYVPGTGETDDYASGASDSDRAHAQPPFTTYSMMDIIALPLKPDPRFRDKIALIGTTYTGDPDKHSIPIFKDSDRKRFVPGVLIHANILRSLIRGQAIGEPHSIGIWVLSVILAGGGIVGFLALRWLKAAVFVIVLGVAWIALAFAVFNSAHFALPINLPIIGLLLSGSLMGGYLSLSEERERRQVMQLWGQYQDPRLVAFLLQNEAARGGQGQEMEVTVLFADLKDFTKTVEHLTPTDTIAALNKYLGMLDSVIRRHGGIVDKYLGDGLMAQWGAPTVPGQPALVEHAEAAVRACLEIQDEEQILAQAGRHDSSAVTFHLRLTLHTGPVVFGWVGAKRLELTIIGDTVNVTSRLQETAKQMDVSFLISENTFDRVRTMVSAGKQAEVEIRGRDTVLPVYEILGGRR